MIKRTFTVLASVLLLAAFLYAHGEPIVGTVTEVGKDSITVKDKTGKTTVVMLESTTKYLKDKKAAAMKDIQVGSRVVIDAHQDAKTKKFAAEEVQIGVTAADAKTDAKSQKMAPAPKTQKKP
jgi:hypothetical protein